MLPVCRKILGREPQRPEWLSALAIAGIAAGAAGLAHDIQGFVSGKTPWDDPGEWTKGALKAGAIGFGGGLLGAGAGAAIGPLIGGAEGATGGAVGGAIGEGTGTVAAEAGAALPQNIAPIISADSAGILSGGTQAPAGMFSEALKNAAMNAGKQSITGAVTGAAQNYENPLKGAMMGAAGGFASSAVGQAGNAIIKGSGGGVFNPAPARGYSLAGSDASFNPPSEYSVAGMGSADGFGRAYNPQAQPFSIGRASAAMSPPTLGQQFAQGTANFAGRGAGAAARMGVGSMMTPQPPMPEQNPYAQWGVTPYWMKRM